MKKLFFIYILLFSSHAFADCEAPALTFEKYEGTLLGYEITKLWNEEEKNENSKPDSVFIRYGVYGYLITPINSQNQPNLVEVSTKDINARLKNSFIRSKYYLDPIDLTYELINVKAYDLTNDAKPDLALFNVSTGANIYSGAIGFINGKWKTLITPMCY